VVPTHGDPDAYHTREVDLPRIAAKGPGHRRRRALAVPDRSRELRAHAPRDSRDGSSGELPPGDMFPFDDSTLVFVMASELEVLNTKD
jgi:hypothetical protein